MEKQKRKIKPRYIFCISALALILVGYFIFVCIYGRNYSIQLFLNGVTDTSTVRVECSRDDVIKLGDIRQGNFNGLLNTLEIDRGDHPEVYALCNAGHGVPQRYPGRR